MIIECRNCGKKYRIDDDKLSAFAKQSIKCKKCNHIIEMRNNTGDLSSSQHAFYEQENDMSRVVARETSDGEYTNEIEGVTWWSSIQFKFSLILCLVLLMILGIYALMDTLATQKRMTEDLNQLARRTATRLSKSLIDPLWTIDENQIQENIFSEMMAKEIFAVIINDADRKTILFGAVRGDDWQIEKTRTPVNGNYIFDSKNIHRENKQLGTVEVYITRKFMDLESFREIRNITVTSVLLIFSIFITTFFTMKKLLIQPISGLTQAAERICLGDLNVKFKHGTKDEIGCLSNALERMQLSLKIAIERCNAP